MSSSTDKKKKSKKEGSSSGTKVSSKESKSSKDKTNSKSSKTTAVSDAPEPHKEHSDFEAGMLFSRYDQNKSGMLAAEDFKNIWREANTNKAIRFADVVDDSKRDVLFEAGVIFSRFENGRGHLTKDSFEKLVREYPQLLKEKPHVESTSSPVIESTLPKEIVSGLLLTHYDETAGVPLSRSAIDHHRALGNLVSPLAESYKIRYDKLRYLLTGKLLPRREHLLQLRRQLQNASIEVASSRKGIERETLDDTDHILDRLRTAESMRQSAIKHQVNRM
jgi:Ca2+-binding EF-hand superfamily protein